MVKTKIEFKDIQAGDLVEAVDKVYGVKLAASGVAFEKFGLDGGEEWRTSQGGIIVADWDAAEIWRIDARVSTFEDIWAGDLIRVTSTESDTEVTITGRAHHLEAADAEWYDGWKTESGQTLVRRLSSGDQKIEILEREQ
jgi:hypothetical protein